MRKKKNGLTLIGVVPVLILYLLSGTAIAQTQKDCTRMVMLQDWNNALTCVQKLQDEDAGWFYPVYLEAKIYRGLGKEEEFLNSLKEAVELASGDKEMFPVFYEFTHFYYTRWKDKDDQKKAEDYCVQAKSVATEADFQPKVFSICGKIAYRTEDWSSAEKDFSKAYSLDRNNPDIAELYIKTLLKRGKEKQAFDILKNAPKNPNTYALLAEVYIKSGQYKEAVQTADDCFKMDRQNTKCMTIGSDGYIGQKNWDEAIKLLQRLTIIKPKDWLGNMKLGDVYMQKRNFDSAVEYLVNSCQNTPSSECGPFISLAVAYENQYLLKNKQKKFLDAAKTTIDQAERRCSGNTRMLEVKERIIKRVEDLTKPKQIEINCDDPKNRNLPECKALEEQENKKKISIK